MDGVQRDTNPVLLTDEDIARFVWTDEEVAVYIHACKVELELKRGLLPPPRVAALLYSKGLLAPHLYKLLIEPMKRSSSPSGQSTTNSGVQPPYSADEARFLAAYWPPSVAKFYNSAPGGGEHQPIRSPNMPAAPIGFRQSANYSRVGSMALKPSTARVARSVGALEQARQGFVPRKEKRRRVKSWQAEAPSPLPISQIGGAPWAHHQNPLTPPKPQVARSVEPLEPGQQRFVPTEKQWSPLQRVQAGTPGPVPATHIGGATWSYQQRRPQGPHFPPGYGSPGNSVPQYVQNVTQYVWPRSSGGLENSPVEYTAQNPYWGQPT